MKNSTRYSLNEVAELCGIEVEIILTFVNRAWLHPADSEQQLFDEEDLARARLIHELRHTMGINDEGVPVVLHLVDQINRLHIEIQTRLR